MDNDKAQPMVGRQEPRICSLLQRQRSVINVIEELTCRISLAAERIDGDCDPKSLAGTQEAPPEPSVAHRLCEHNEDLEKIESTLGRLAERFESLV